MEILALLGWTLAFILFYRNWKLKTQNFNLSESIKTKVDFNKGKSSQKQTSKTKVK